MYSETLKLIVTRAQRRPASCLPRELNPWFSQLAHTQYSEAAETAEDKIWRLWMHYPQTRAAQDLERATRAIAAFDFPAAEGILNTLLARHPDYAEAWNKRATLYFIQMRDEESLQALHRTLQLEPRHFGAVCGFAEICLSHEYQDHALFAFEAALALNPHLDGIRARVNELLTLLPERAH
ncbi:MAG TPA: hypothetical protein VJM53_09645 [Burkholderiales bacterium]|jgi:Tfp pilus assembly protein PilF|nr:hypothetical protein [Burkholderiales bacterium]